MSIPNCNTPCPLNHWAKVLLFWSMIFVFAPVNAFAQGNPMDTLVDQLRQDGFTQRQVASLTALNEPPLYQTVSKTLHVQESQLNYNQFLEPSRLSKAEQFLQTHEQTLIRAEKGFGVDRTVIVAILLVETHLGQYTGKTPTLAVLSTFALMDQESARDTVWELLSEKDRAHWGREAFDARLLKRSRWAYAELCALLRWSESQGTRPESYYGSVMGAVGWPQFLPSSMIHYGVDGNHDGRVDLFHPEDAIFSVANYFRGHGWPQARDRSAKERVVHRYNKSRPYVYTILEIASRIQ